MKPEGMSDLSSAKELRFRRNIVSTLLYLSSVQNRVESSLCTGWLMGFPIVDRDSPRYRGISIKSSIKRDLNTAHWALQNQWNVPREAREKKPLIYPNVMTRCRQVVTEALEEVWCYAIDGVEVGWIISSFQLACAADATLGHDILCNLYAHC